MSIIKTYRLSICEQPQIKHIPLHSEFLFFEIKHNHILIDIKIDKKEPLEERIFYIIKNDINFEGKEKRYFATVRNERKKVHIFEYNDLPF